MSVGYVAGHYDVIVLGTGHAGCEAALASARMGCRTLALTINLDNVGLMPCNPAIGGPGKGHLVREIAALGGEMGRMADRASLQVRLLNTGKGPAVRALRVLCDKARYQALMRRTLERQAGLDLKQAMATRLMLDDGRVAGVVTATGVEFRAPAVILASGVYLEGRVITGEHGYPSGPHGQLSALGLSGELRGLGLRLNRFKTGTPPRVHRRSLDFERLIPQYGDDVPRQFSFEPVEARPQHVCWLTHTNERTHELIRSNLKRSPLYTGAIRGTGPRYCPSIEDKVVRFAGRTSHQVFFEPEGEDTDEMYVLGLSTSLPEDVQLELLRTLPGCGRVEIMRPGYAIEYDCLDPTELGHSLECRKVPGLYSAGQVNGTSGYEEAAAQGLVAGINAALRHRGQPAFILGRSEAYIGVLIDDLVTKGTDEPYRMMTSRAEYRLLLRQDNADLRLTPKGRELGLVDEERMTRVESRRAEIERVAEALVQRKLSVGEAASCPPWTGAGALTAGMSLADLLKRPGVEIQHLGELEPALRRLPAETADEITFRVKYQGYIEKQEAQVARLRRLENRAIPQDMDYCSVTGLSTEGREKLQRVRPASLGQASRIPGVTPADLSILMVKLESRRR
ncbi:MAG: tRNA uridine-5-carboxymethylaminomethyl(34) synthesis enzyme MnmG [Bacillota bacterium]